MLQRLPVAIAVVSAVLFGAAGLLWWRDDHRVHTLTLAAGSESGEYYAFSRALAATVERYHPEIRIEVQATAGSQDNQSLLTERAVDLALMQSDTPVSPATQLVARLYPEPVHLLARQDAEIASIADLRGKRVALPPTRSGAYALFAPIRAHYGLQESDFAALIPLDPAEARAQLHAGDVDALFAAIGLGNPAIRTLLGDKAIHLVPIGQGEALQLFQPAFEVSAIPKGTYSGSLPIPPTDLPTVAVRALLVAHRDVDAEVVLAIAQTLFEARSELIAAYPLASTIPIPGHAATDLGLIFHSGARAYYEREQPSFWLEYAELLGFALSASVLVLSGVWQFGNWLEGSRKNRADRYNRQILQLLEDTQATTSPAQLAATRAQLFEIFAKVTIDLDEDRITPESFQSFAFAWQVADATLRHRETLLQSELAAES